MHDHRQTVDDQLDAFVALGDATRRLEHAEMERMRSARSLADAYLAHLDAGSPELHLADELPFRVDQYRATVLEVDRATTAVSNARAATATPAQ